MAKYTIELEIFTYDELVAMSEEEQAKHCLAVAKCYDDEKIEVADTKEFGISATIDVEECLIRLPDDSMGTGEIMPEQAGQYTIISYDNNLINYVPATKID